MSAALCWLHLSDLHITSSSDEGRQDRWMNEVERDLPKLLEEKHLSPDFVLVSGDIANSGQATEYELALNFFETLRDRLPRRSARWMFVPGNHDVNWSKIDKNRDLQLRAETKAITDDERLASALSNEHDQKYVGKRHGNFRDFSERAARTLQAPMPERDNSAVMHLNVGDIEIAIAGLNSALLSTRKDLIDVLNAEVSTAIPDLDLQALAVGLRQLQQAVRSVESADVRIAVMHHPPLSEWFLGPDHLSQRSYLGRFDFIHRGHEHLPSQTHRTLAGLRDDLFEIAAGALYVSERWYRGFCVVSIDEDAELVNTHYFAYGSRANRWIPDVETAGQGIVSTRVPLDLAKRLARKGVGRGREDRLLPVG